MLPETVSSVSFVCVYVDAYINVLLDSSPLLCALNGHFRRRVSSACCANAFSFFAFYTCVHLRCTLNVCIYMTAARTYTRRLSLSLHARSVSLFILIKYLFYYRRSLRLSFFFFFFSLCIYIHTYIYILPPLFFSLFFFCPLSLILRISLSIRFAPLSLSHSAPLRIQLS